ncbi:MAG: DUF3150 domain-containing protein [Desulfuromonadaceae bacterium]|nr:DUF3150 domain-containing protein [Desulfuromonadaceae bacterium]
MKEILSKLVVVSLSISLWTGRKKLSPEDLGLDFSKLPPEKLATLGSKKICDPEKLAVFSALKRRAERHCEAVGVRFLGGYAIPEDKAEEVMKVLDGVRDEFEKEKTEFLLEYDRSIREWIEANPEWAGIIEVGVEPASTAARRLGFTVQVFKVKNIDGLDKGLNEQTNSLSERLIFEINQQARQAWEESYKGRASVTRKALRPIKSMLDKLRGLEFLSPYLISLAVQVEDVLATLPKTGPIEGRNLTSLIGILHVLGDLPLAEVPAEEEEELVEDIPFEAIPAEPVSLPSEWFF